MGGERERWIAAKRALESTEKGNGCCMWFIVSDILVVVGTYMTMLCYLCSHGCCLLLFLCHDRETCFRCLW